MLVNLLGEYDGRAGCAMEAGIYEEEDVVALVVALVVLKQEAVWFLYRHGVWKVVPPLHIGVPF